MASPQNAYREITIDELIAEATARFGADPHDWAFVCPNCGDVATARDFEAIGADSSSIGQECIGRHFGVLHFATRRAEDRGCSWVAYGILLGPWDVVAPAKDGQPERRLWVFPLADAPAAPATFHKVEFSEPDGMDLPAA